MKSWQMNGRVLHSRLLFVVFVVRLYLSDCWDVVLYAAVQRRLTAGTCRNIISDYLDHEKLSCGNYLRKE